jgi:hypothetical protein
MSVIYVLSDSENINRYKVGSHTGKLEKLKSRYITAIPTLVVNYFIETPDAKQIENIFKQIHINRRIKNANENISEWVTMKLDEIVSSLLAISIQCDSSKVNGTTTMKFNSTISESHIIQNNAKSPPSIRSSIETTELPLTYFNQNSIKTPQKNIILNPKSWLDRLFDDDDHEFKNKCNQEDLLPHQNHKDVSQYYIWPEMIEMLRNKTAWIKIEDKWTNVKFQSNGNNLQMLIL